MTWQFLPRGGKLEMLVSMRSWDLVWGLSYDVPCFVAVQLALAAALDLEPGTYTHVAGSGHLYERHWRLVSLVGNQELPNPSAGARSTREAGRRARWALSVARRSLAGHESLVTGGWGAAIRAWAKRFTSSSKEVST